MNEFKIFPHLHDVFQTAADEFVRRAVDAVNAKGVFTVVLAGGNTPKSFFDVLTSVKYSNKQIPWHHIKFFFTDERYVPANDPLSNSHMANQYLFAKVPVLAENIFPIPTEFNDPKDAAQHYEWTLRKTFRIKDNEFPQFDLIYLGLGEDAHTASLMPFSDVVKTYSDPQTINQETKYQLVVALWVAKLKMYRITLTPPVINNAACIIFLVTGANKASAVSAVLEGSNDPQRYPAQLIVRVHGKTFWYLDQDAAGKLNQINKSK